MKLRILDNKLRFRLTQPEVMDLAAGKVVVVKVRFDLEGNELVYGIHPTATGNGFSVSYKEHEIKVSVAKEIIDNWLPDDQVGIYQKSDLGNSKFLDVHIEKDFQCLHKRPGEDESQNFKNPKSTS